MTDRFHKLGYWGLQHRQWTQKWMDNLIKHVNEHEKALKHELREFQEIVDGDVSLWILASLMFTEIPEKKPYNCDIVHQPQVRDFHHMLKLINHIMDSGPP